MPRFTRAMLTSLMLIGLLPLPALAQGQNEADTVTKTFRLTLLGTVPREEAFRVIYEVGGSRAPAGGIDICGDRAPVACQGGGRTYERSVEFERGVGVRSIFLREISGNADNTEVFHWTVEVLNTDTTSVAYYDFGSGDSQQGEDTDQQMPESMPSTGAGGMCTDRFQQLSFGGSGNSYRPMSASSTRYETRRSVSQTNFRTFRVYDTSVRNPDGHLISYELDSDASHTFRGPSYEPWTGSDVYYTRNRTCERYDSHNPTYGGCGDDLSDFANGQWVNDAVLWCGHTFHHLARDEDDPRMSVRWSSFRLVPRDMTSTTSR
ncbi:MAG: hypothetical protein M3P51_04950 [Chloroflexota bacterium]|nr:hypothetical protein [Chloroflexota bacterium]